MVGQTSFITSAMTLEKQRTFTLKSRRSSHGCRPCCRRFATTAAVAPKARSINMKHTLTLFTALLLAPLAALQAAEKPLSDWQHLVRSETWPEK
jgi:hypothetical protein